MLGRLSYLGKFKHVILGVVFFTAVISVIFYFLFFPLNTYNALLKMDVRESTIAKLYSNNAPILLLLGNRHLGGKGEYNLIHAERYFKTASEVQPDLQFVHYQLSRVYFLTTRYTLALEEVNKEIANSPNFSRSYYLRGLIHGYAKNLPDAATDFREFIKREPDEWAGYNDLAWILFQLGEYTEVKLVIENILGRTRNAWLLNAYGVALLNLEENKEALVALREAKDLASRMTPELWGVAYIGNDPTIYTAGLEEMRRNINENIEVVNNRLSKK